jgi:hypothetical protein
LFRTVSWSTRQGVPRANQEHLPGVQGGGRRRGDARDNKVFLPKRCRDHGVFAASTSIPGAHGDKPAWLSPGPSPTPHGHDGTPSGHRVRHQPARRRAARRRRHCHMDQDGPDPRRPVLRVLRRARRRHPPSGPNRALEDTGRLDQGAAASSGGRRPACGRRRRPSSARRASDDESPQWRLHPSPVLARGAANRPVADPTCDGDVSR